jgi:hypothetical protein
MITGFIINYKPKEFTKKRVTLRIKKAVPSLNK